MADDRKILRVFSIDNHGNPISIIPNLNWIYNCLNYHLLLLNTNKVLCCGKRVLLKCERKHDNIDTEVVLRKEILKIKEYKYIADMIQRSDIELGFLLLLIDDSSLNTSTLCYIPYRETGNILLRCVSQPGVVFTLLRKKLITDMPTINE
jgi:hypothetical protein